MQENTYMPSSSERKRAIVAYLLIGLFFFSGKEELSVYEYFHYKQAMGWYCTTMILFLAWIILIWIPVLKWLPFLFVLANLVIMVIFIYKAWKGEYSANLLQNEKWKTLYADVWGWLLWLFDIKKRVYWDIATDTWISLDNFEEMSNLDQEISPNLPDKLG